MKKQVALFVCLFAAVCMADSKPIPLVKVDGEGRFAVVKAADVPTVKLEEAMQKLGRVLQIECEVKKGDWQLATSQKCLEASGANAAVFIVKDKALPMSLVAMEAKWGVVNAEGLDEEQLMKEVLRVSTVVLGGASSRYKASVMRPVFSKDDLTSVAGNSVSVDSVMAIANYLLPMGIRRYQMMTRSEAIEAGYLKGESSAKKDNE